MTTTHVRLLADFAASCRDGLPAAVRTDVAGRILDVLGNCLAAYAEPDGDAAPAVLRAVRRWSGAEEATAIGSGHRLPAPSAALVNGTLAHALDYDDTHLPSVLHPSAPVVPAALAAAEATGAGGAELAAAVAAGIEVCNRLGMASYLPEAGNSLFFDRGQHATSICGTLGAAVAAGMVYGLPAAGLADAIGIAASMGSGVIEANRTGGTVKRVHCGWAAHSGVSAAVMALEGVTGPPTVLEGRFGFFQAWLDGRYDAGALLDDLGDRWELLRTVYKPYPTNHFTHPAIDCALALRERLDPAQIEEIELGVAAPVLRTIAEPPEEKAAPRSPYHAKFSGPYTVATAFLGSGAVLGVSPDDFADLDSARLALAARVRCVADARATELFPRSFAAVLRVRLAGGTVLEHRVDSSLGSPEHPLTVDDLARKFRDNAGRALPEDRVAALVAAARSGASATQLLSLSVSPVAATGARDRG
ncbi:MmgE/PrpD family protein [Nonomuraea typhae]|uniref:MmgE/PrpD family protein n=1 Tax=Nonomuraea typhae TaxID=2603600 RepID=A0ABW7Z304_9ACTN